MKSIARLGWIAGALLFAAQGLAEDQIPWVADFRTACGMAAEQRRLVLLHFYSDNCGPCVRLEQNVFNKPEVGEAVAQNYLAVKVHAGKNPQLASRYHVNQWPTDVFVTPSGLEVYRTISPREAPDYIALLNQVAQQTGIGTGRNWKNQVAQATQNATADAQQASQQLAAGVQNASNQAQNDLRAAASQFQLAADTARAKSSQVGAAFQQTQQQVAAAAEQTQQQTSTAVDQTRGAANKWSQQARDAVSRYEQQGGDAYRQFREKADQAGQQVQKDAQAARQEWRSATQKAAEEAGETVQNLKNQWQQGPSSTPFDRRSAFTPAESSPAAQPAASPAAPSAAPALPQIVNHPAPPAAPQPKPQSPVANQPLLPTENPWVTSRQAEKPRIETPQAEPPAVATIAPDAGTQQANTAPPFIPAQPESPAAPPSLAANPPSPGDHKLPLVPASQAPPLALDGFCPVTLMETMAKNPADRAAWKKGDKQFGAIHRGRTYLFVTPDAQQRFLANPDAYAPVLAGCDPVRFAERGEMVDGKRAYGLLTPDKRMVLFADEVSRNRFEQSPDTFTPAIQQAMRGGDGSLYR
jgi:hypothetical protein